MPVTSKRRWHWLIALAAVLLALCVVFLVARLEYLRRWAAFHEREAVRVETQAESSIVGIAFRDAIMRNHQEQSQKYRDAMFRPWNRVEQVQEFHSHIELELGASKSSD